MSDQNNSVFEQRVASLRELLDQNDLDALIVSHDDEYLSYELNEDEERLKYITGFQEAQVMLLLPAMISRSMKKALK